MESYFQRAKGKLIYNGTSQQLLNQAAVDNGPYDMIPEVAYKEPVDSRAIAVLRVSKFKDILLSVNPHVKDIEQVDEALRIALSGLVRDDPLETVISYGKGSNVDKALRYLRDRISVPRDMPIYSARRLREALEKTASVIGDGWDKSMSEGDRFDQNSLSFHSKP